MAERELIVSLSELTRAEIICSDDKCGGTVTLDLSKALGADKDGVESSKCPICKEPIITPMVKIVQAWQTFISQVGNGKIQFRIKGNHTVIDLGMF
jgi:hypothetical protein